MIFQRQIYLMNVKWEEVIGQEKLKETLNKEVIEPLKLEGIPLRWRFILLYGAVGVGKTYLMHGLGSQVPHFQHIHMIDLVSKWQTQPGPGERLRELFEKAVANQPSVIFLGDLYYRITTLEDGNIITSRLLTELDGITLRGDRVVVVGTSSEPWQVATRLLERFDQLLYVPLPHQEARINIMKYHLQNTKTAFPVHMLSTLGPSTAGFSPADLGIFIHDVLMQPVRKVQRATHYKKVTGPDPDNPTVIVDDLLTPCPAGDIGAMEMTWENISASKLLSPLITMDDMKILLSRSQPTVKEADLIQLQMFSVPPPNS